MSPLPPKLTPQIEPRCAVDRRPLRKRGFDFAGPGAGGRGRGRSDGVSGGRGRERVNNRYSRKQSGNRRERGAFPTAALARRTKRATNQQRYAGRHGRCEAKRCTANPRKGAHYPPLPNSSQFCKFGPFFDTPLALGGMQNSRCCVLVRRSE